MAHEDSITLNQQEYIIDGPVNARSIAEFSAGFKIGRATYDDREHAFFLVLDDFSGGIGFRRIDIHEALGGMWDNEGGVDIRRSHHITLPPQRQTLTGFDAPTAIGFTGHRRAMALSSLSGTEFMYLGAGNKVYTVDATRTTIVTRATLQAAGPIRVANNVNRIFEWRDPDTNTRRIYVLDEGADLTARYWYSANGTTFTEGTRVVWDGVVWDGKIVASMPLPAGSPHGTTGQIVAGYSTDGILWNVDNADAAISRPKWRFQGLPFWIGVAVAPWGFTAPYFLDDGKLYVLDFYKEDAIEIEEVGDKTRLVHGGVFEGYVWVSDGWNIWIYDPGGSETVRRVGIYNRFGVPPTMQDFTTAHFIGGTSTLYLMAESNLTAIAKLMAYTGVGWTTLSPAIASTNPIASNVNRFPLGQSLTQPSRFIDVFCNTAELSTSLKLISWKLPTSGDIPTPNDGFFEDGPLSFETGWYDGGFLDIKGALFRVFCDAFSLTANETVAVEYRLDNSDGAYTSLGTFSSSVNTLWFDVNHRGVEWRTVQFKITLDRGSNSALTPELIALTLVYDKKPEFRSAWTFRIDVNRMVERAIVGTNWIGVATPFKIWEALKFDFDIKTLLPLVVPNLELNVNVRIVDMPMTFDDFRNAVDGKGYIDISVLQPIAG